MNGCRRSRTIATVAAAWLTTALASAQPGPPPPPPPPPAPDQTETPPPPPATPKPEPTPAPAPAARPSRQSASAEAQRAEARGLTLLEVIRTALRKHPSIRFAENDLAASSAALLGAKGPFDPAILANAGHRHDEVPVLPPFSLGIPGYDANVTDTTNLDLGASWFTRWGMTIAPTVGLARIHQRPGGSVAAPGLATDPFHQAQVDLTVTQSLLRGAGTVGAASGIDAALFGQKAAAHRVAHAAQQQVFLAVITYFQLVAAHEIVSILEENQASAERLVEDTAELVRADQRPAADLRQLEGNLASRARAVYDARNTEIQTLYALYEAMGLGATARVPLVPVNELPRPRVPAISDEEVVRRARNARRDLKALGQSVASAEAALDGAQKNTQPALDLSVSVGYNGALDDDGVDAFFASAGSNVPGVSGGVNLALELPVQNIAREAARDAALVQRDRAKIALRDLARRVPIDVLTARNDLRLSVAALEESTRAVEQYRQALDNERDRLREGVGTVIDVVFAQQQLIGAQQNQILDHARYAAAVARFQFELGALPDEEREAMRAAAELLGRAVGQGAERVGN